MLCPANIFIDVNEHTNYSNYVNLELLVHSMIRYSIILRVDHKRL